MKGHVLEDVKVTVRPEGRRNWPGDEAIGWGSRLARPRAERVQGPCTRKGRDEVQEEKGAEAARIEAGHAGGVRAPGPRGPSQLFCISSWV